MRRLILVSLTAAGALALTTVAAAIRVAYRGRRRPAPQTSISLPPIVKGKLALTGGRH